MKAISIGTDRKIFEEGSAVRARMVEYGKLFEELHLVVFSTRIMNYESRIMISENVFAYPTNSRNRVAYVFDAFKICRRIIHNSKFLIHNSVLSTQDPFETGLVGLLLKLRYKLPLQIQLHTDFANKYFITHSLLNAIRFPLGIFVLSFADSVRVVSKRIEKSIHSLAHNVSILPISTSPLASRGPLLAKEREGNKGVKFLTVARLEKEKDLETAIEAFKKLSDNGIEATFTIVGDGSERASLELRAKSLKVGERVKFVGWQNDLARFYEEADVYVSTSLYEGYGMSSVEAAGHGLPLIISDTGVAGELFGHKKEALIFKQRDVGALVEAMNKLATDQNLRREMGEKAKAAALTNQTSQADYLIKYRASIQTALDFYAKNHSFFKTNILLRYFVAGIIGASSNIGLLYMFTDILGIWYLKSSVLAFAIAFVVSFLLQKFWTFKDGNIDQMHHQAALYFLVAILGLGFNTGLMFSLVDILQIWYILAQIIAGGCIMIFNFLMYKFVIFKKY